MTNKRTKKAVSQLPKRMPNLSLVQNRKILAKSPVITLTKKAISPKIISSQKRKKLFTVLTTSISVSVIPEVK